MTRLGILLVVGVLVAPGAAAHQLDEYLQATRLDLSRERIVVELDLTPGAAIANAVLALIDRDQDGAIADLEVDAYARQVLRDVSLRVDERDVAVAVTRVAFPEWDDVREGVGTIRIEAVGHRALSGSGFHRVVFENVHQRETSVYLVNALKPSTRDVVIGAQHRDTQQRRLELDVEVGDRATSALWAASAFLMTACLLLARHRRATSRWPAESVERR
jgi:hypothetical protein